VAALPLPLQDFHLLAFASFAGRTHQDDTLNMKFLGYFALSHKHSRYAVFKVL